MCPKVTCLQWPEHAIVNTKRQRIIRAVDFGSKCRLLTMFSFDTQHISTVDYDWPVATVAKPMLFGVAFHSTGEARSLGRAMSNQIPNSARPILGLVSSTHNLFMTLSPTYLSLKQSRSEAIPLGKMACSVQGSVSPAVAGN